MILEQAKDQLIENGYSVTESYLVENQESSYIILNKDGVRVELFHEHPVFQIPSYTINYSSRSTEINIEKQNVVKAAKRQEKKGR